MFFGHSFATIEQQVGDLGQFPCAGVYAVIAAPGVVRVNDRVVIN